jgi:hypothetical protein
MQEEFSRVREFPVKGICCKTRGMANSDPVIRKKRGRPRVAQLPVVSFRLRQGWRQEIDHWRSEEPGNLSRSDAIRTLIFIGLWASYAKRERKQAAREATDQAIDGQLSW